MFTRNLTKSIISNSKDGVITSHTMHAMNMGVMGLVLSMINKYRRAPLYLTTNRNPQCARRLGGF